MTLDAAFLAWVLLAVLVTLTPGPDTLLVVAHSMKSGARAGFAAAAGVVAGFVWYAGLAFFGFMAVLAATPWLYSAVKIGGAIYLVWIGAGMMLGAFRPQTQEKAPKLGAPFRQGLLTNALNPKVALFYLAVLPQFIGAGPEAPARAVLLIGVHYLTGAIWLGCVAAAAAQAGVRLRRSAFFRWLEGVIGAALVGLGVRLVLDQRA